MSICLNTIHQLPSLCDVITLYDEFRERHTDTQCARLFQLIDQYTQQTTQTKIIEHKQECEVECPHCTELFDLTLHSVAEIKDTNSFFGATEITLYGELI